jgi:hypothetical protein
MAERPIILFPEPQLADRDKRKVAIPHVNKPSFDKQYSRLEPTFKVLKDAFEKKKVQIQNTPIGMNPEYALVFEVVGSVDSFYTAVKNSDGLEWLFDKESLDIEPDEDFYFDKEKDKNLYGKVYCIMSNQEAMEQMLSCWRRFNDGESDVFARGYAGLRDIFVNIKEIRMWTSEDRIQETQIIEYWRESLELDGNKAVPFEVELFYRKDKEKRRLAEQAVVTEIDRLGGHVLNRCYISEIDYHALLVELPRNRIEELVENYEQVQLVHIDDVMFFRPICQSAFNVYIDDSIIEEVIDEDISMETSSPIIGVFDGMPIQNHPLLKNRIILDDPDDYASSYESKNRCHGTAMSSLILNGDLNKKEYMKHSIYLRPILKPREVGPDNFVEEIPSDCLIVDKIHASVARLFENQNGIEPVAPTIRIINLSLGDPVRQLATLMSPLARLIDYLAYKYSVLFIVSAGNHPETINMLESTFDELKKKNIQERSEEYFRCLSKNQRNIKVLSPAENINGLTIGAIYDDYCDVSENDRAILAVQKGLPSPISSYGKGYRSIITPDLFYRGGRKLIYGTWNGKCEWAKSNREPGCKVAAPTLNSTKNGQAFTFGTSDAAALISHEALKCYDILNDIYHAEIGEMPPKEYIAILIKAMLTHGASWGNLAGQVARLTGTKEKQISKWLGYGIPNISRVEECAKNRVTLIGSGSLKKDEGHIFTLPLPVDISSKIIKRRLIVTLAYFSPVEVNKQAYRSAKIWFDVIGNEQLAASRENTEWQAVQKGTLQHEIFEGEKALIWDDDKVIKIKVNCKEDAGKLKKSIPYCIFVTFEVAEGQNIDVYSKVVNKVKMVIKP